MILAPSLARAAFAALLATFAAGCSEASGKESPAPRQANAAAAPGACGSRGQPDCPLQGWMKATVQAYLNAGDKERLATSLDELAKHAPAGYTGWDAAAKAGADAARGGDLGAVRAQCQACHQQSRARFRAEMRTTRLF